MVEKSNKETLKEDPVFGAAELAIAILAFAFVLSTTILINVF